MIMENKKRVGSREEWKIFKKQRRDLADEILQAFMS